LPANVATGSSRTLRPCLAILLICLGALASFRTTWSAASAWRRPPADNSPPTILARFEPLEELLPKDAAIGFLVDERYADPKVFLPAGRLWLASYVLSPRGVNSWTDQALVIVDSGMPAPLPEAARSRGWILVADLHNGVRLFRTRRAR
jgi:hypothetical protein